MVFQGKYISLCSNASNELYTALTRPPLHASLSPNDIPSSKPYKKTSIFEADYPKPIFLDAVNPYLAWATMCLDLRRWPIIFSCRKSTFTPDYYKIKLEKWKIIILSLTDLSLASLTNLA